MQRLEEEEFRKSIMKTGTKKEATNCADMALEFAESESFFCEREYMGVGCFILVV